MDGILGLIVVFLIYIGAAHIGLSFFGEGGNAAWFGVILGGIGLIGFIRAMNQSWKSPPDEAPSNRGTNTQTQIETTRVLPSAPSDSEATISIASKVNSSKKLKCPSCSGRFLAGQAEVKSAIMVSEFFKITCPKCGDEWVEKSL